MPAPYGDKTAHMLVIRGTNMILDRLGGASADDTARSTTE